MQSYLNLIMKSPTPWFMPSMQITWNINLHHRMTINNYLLKEPLEMSKPTSSPSEALQAQASPMTAGIYYCNTRKILWICYDRQRLIHWSQPTPHSEDTTITWSIQLHQLAAKYWFMIVHQLEDPGLTEAQKDISSVKQPIITETSLATSPIPTASGSQIQLNS